jgi:hypothetical protein
MNKSLVAAVSVLLIAGMLFLLVLKSYTVEIVHAVVVNALVQKAPEGYDLEKIRRVFNNALARAENEGARESYLKEMQRIFHSLEKRQYLEPDEMDRLLAGFNKEE